MYLHEHLEKLRYFYEVGRLGSMKKASEAAFVTQPSLSKSIKILEEVVGQELFVRLPRGVRLTEYGDILYQYCHELFSSLKDLEKRLESSDDPMAGSLRVGTYDSIGIYFWPKFLKEFLPKYPNLSLEISTGRSAQMQDLLDKGELDLILIINPKKTPQTIIESLRKDVFKFYKSTKKKTVFKTIEEAPFILMPDSFAPGANLKEKLGVFNIDERKIYKTSSLESVKELTLNGLGLGFLPESVCTEHIEKGALEVVDLGLGSKNGLFPHTIGLGLQKSRKDNPLVNQVISEIKARF
ncbi:MAG: LysR family transcriptional regulator [Bacteriovoracaceae bacterium]|nr:LysR family transcriptional regulator [Bacteriovoracaceae bacterium]